MIKHSKELHNNQINSNNNRNKVYITDSKERVLSGDWRKSFTVRHYKTELRFLWKHS